MKEDKNRRKFIKEVISALAISSFALPLVAKAKEKEKGKMVKMLTPDGKLVEVEASVLKQANKKKADNKDILNWVKPKS